MINLIPPKAKKRLLIEYWVRVVSVWVTLWSIALAIGTMFFLPVYVLLSSQVSLYESSAAEASQKVADYDTAATALVQTSLQARDIENESTLTQFSTLIAMLEAGEGQGVTISRVQLDRDERAIEPLQVAGKAIDRQALASFRDRLLAEEQVESVDLPISNLASDKDISFTITVKLVSTIET